MAVTTSNDDGFREIQLNGKQLVFLFMAVTVVLVVTFLTGVLVGRGVRAERVAEQQTEALTEAPATPPQSVIPPPSGADPTVAPPPEPPADGPVTTDTKPPAVQEVEPPVAVKRNAPVETSASQPKAAETTKTNPPARPASEPAATIKAPAPAASAPKPAASAPPATSGATPSQPATPAATDSPARDGYAVQVAAVNVRGEADSIVKRLSGKGYSAYVEDPKGSQKMYRVRVGTFKTRREAQTVADRLKKDEKFKPWVTR